MISNSNRSGKLSDNQRDRKVRKYTDVRSGSYPVADSDKIKPDTGDKPKTRIIYKDGKLSVSEG